MKIRTTCLLLGMGLLAGCWQKSLNPFYTTGDLVSEPRLVGTWHEQWEQKRKENGMTWSFSEGIEKGYKLTITSEDETNHYAARLFKLDGQRYLDILAQQRTVSMIPAHNLFKVVEADSSLKLAALNIDWVQKWLRKNPGVLTHIAIIDEENPDDREKDELVLTSDTKALQKWLRDQSKETELFSDTTVFKK